MCTGVVVGVLSVSDVSLNFKPKQRLTFFPSSNTFYSHFQYWLFPESDSNMTYINEIARFKIEMK